MRHVDVLVVGAGQAGLGTAYWLGRTNALRVLVLDGAEPGQTWLDRWDSLQLFTPRRFSGLPGLPFPKGPAQSPSRVEMAAYLKAYAARFALPVETGTRVVHLGRDAEGFLASTDTGPVRARHVVIATGPFHRPYVPEAGQELDPSVHQLHSYDYRRPGDVPTQEVTVVGGGNSAAQLAVELAATHEVTVACPRAPWFLPENPLGVSMYWWTLLTGILNASSNSRVARYIQGRGDAVVGTELRHLVRTGRVRLVTERVVAGRGRELTLAGGTVLPVSTVLWCTGFLPDTSWIDLDGALDDQGRPVHDAGASPVSGLHWMGLPWQTRLNSSIIDGVDRDARRTAARIVQAGVRDGSPGYPAEVPPP